MKQKIGKKDSEKHTIPLKFLSAAGSKKGPKNLAKEIDRYLYNPEP